MYEERNGFSMEFKSRVQKMSTVQASIVFVFRSVYNPPQKLQYPGSEVEELEAPEARPESPGSDDSSSHSDLSSPSLNRDSEADFTVASRAESSGQPTPGTQAFRAVSYLNLNALRAT